MSISRAVSAERRRACGRSARPRSAAAPRPPVRWPARRRAPRRRPRLLRRRPRQKRSSVSTSARVRQTGVPSSICCALSSGTRWAADDASGSSSVALGAVVLARRPRPRRGGRRRSARRARAGPAGRSRRRPAVPLRHRRSAPVHRRQRPSRSAGWTAAAHSFEAVFSRYPQLRYRVLGGTSGPATPPGHRSDAAPRVPRLLMRRPEGAVWPASAGDHKVGRVHLLGITVVFRHARWVAAAAARDAGPSPGPRLAPAGRARGVRAAVAAAGRGRPGAGPRARAARPRPGWSPLAAARGWKPATVALYSKVARYGGIALPTVPTPEPDPPELDLRPLTQVRSEDPGAPAGRGLVRDRAGLAGAGRPRSGRCAATRCTPPPDGC